MWLRFFVAVLAIYPFKITMSQNTCEFRETCRECIRDPHRCVWCTTANMTKARCTSIDHAATCNDRDIENPLSRVEHDDSLNFSYTLGQYRQLQPTKVDIWLRPGDTQEFTFHFKPAKDYPLDLYFLIDFSKSMDAAVARTAERDISNGLRDLTNNVYLGLGSFIDKKAAPYVLSTDQNTYSFKHHLNLTANAKLFSHAINNARLGSNFDPSEGGLDALAQVLACKEKIGWREDSRKIIIFLTDESYHVAGDGKWAGIFTPYDGKCYMENDEYTKELEMDYPSIGQINKLVDENQITVYFAVLEKVYDEYKMLTNVITGSLCGRLQNNSQSFVDAIHDMYKSLSQSLSIQLNINDLDHNHIDVEIDPDCLGRSLDNPQCKMASTNRDMKNFTAIVALKNYYGVNETTFSVTPQGFREKLDVNIHVINECECTDRGERNSIFCNKHGIYECGVCRCKPERYGSNCQCKGTGDNNDNSTCIAGNVELLCSGRGTCKCGKCECYPDYEGQFCEFSKDDCPGKTREGPCSMHGTCQLGNCVCHTGWTGEKCDCPTSTEYCRHFDDKETPGIVSYGEECSGLGNCTCGECKCRKTAVWDSRRQNSDYCYFEPCAECHEQQCQAVAACALCQHKTLDSNVESCARSCDSEFVVHKTNETQTNYTEPWKICRLTTDIGCFTTFAYKYEGPNKLELHVSTQNDCMESYYRFGGSALGVVLLIGLLTLITWKALTTLRDRREYEAFKNQHDAAEWEYGANPIYESPNTTFYNPAFGQN